MAVGVGVPIMLAYVYGVINFKFKVRYASLHFIRLSHFHSAVMEHVEEAVMHH